jgi:hypothetical protein
LVGVVLLVAAFAGQNEATAQRRTPSAVSWEQRAAPASDNSALRRQIAEQWRVIPLRDGVLLAPRRSGRSFTGVELRGGTVAVDGRVVTGAELRELLGADADAVLAASYLSAEELAGWARSGRRAGPVPAPSEPAPAPEITVRRHGARVAIGRDLVIGEGERVGDDAVAILGSVTVNGEVEGNVVAIGGEVRLGPRAVVRGDVTSVGGGISAEPTAKIAGATNEVAVHLPRINVQPPDLARWSGWWRPSDHWFAGVSLAWTFLRLLLVGVLALAFAALLGPALGRMRYHVQRTPVVSGLLGIGVQLLIVPVVIAVVLVLAISIVGIPLLPVVPLLLLAGGLFWVAGFAAVAQAVGESLAGRGRPMLALVAGLGLIWATTIIARLVWWSTGGTVAAVLSTLGFTIEFLAWSVGLGAALLAWRRPVPADNPLAVPQVPGTPFGL